MIDTATALTIGGVSGPSLPYYVKTKPRKYGETFGPTTELPALVRTWLDCDTLKTCSSRFWGIGRTAKPAVGAVAVTG